MSACCEPQGYDRVFDDREARRAAARYRRSGLTSLPQRTIELYRDGTISGGSLLEIGAGIGDFQIEMLKAGVTTAVGVDMSPAYDGVASELLDENGLSGRVERRTGDVVVHRELATPADVVALHSVVCCYADARGLLTVAADHARRFLVVSFPRHTWWLRAVVPFINVYPRLRHSDWRFYVHAEPTILTAVEDRGLRLVHHENLRVDHHVVFARQ